MANIAVDIFLENLKQQMSSKLDLIIQEKEQLQSLYEEIGFLRAFLKHSEEKRYDRPELKNLAVQIRDVAYKAENIVDLFIVDAFIAKERSSMPGKVGHDAPDLSLNLESVKNEIKIITTEVKKIYDKTYEEQEAVVVGFDDQVEKIKERLINEEERSPLEIISIVGSPGTGKTTLAREVYNDKWTKEQFPIRAWITVSQTYLKRDLLIGILKSAFPIKQQDHGMMTDDDKLGQELFNRLKGKKYLVVMDDMWSIQAWEDIKRSFPNDGTGSKVIFTSRLVDLAKVAQRDSHPHLLLPLSGGQSWELLQLKVFGKQSCPSELEKIGKEIAEKCGGLPLAIVVIAGILAMKEKTREWWKEVAKSLSSIIARNQEVYLETVALSYNHLPLHLKACFVYLGAFPEDYEIPVRKLTWLWIAEGFVEQSPEKSLEAVAEDYLMDLVGRSLVMTATKRSNGRIKTCRIHDLLRDLCLRKAEEDNLLQHIYKDEQISSSSTIANRHRRLYISRQIFDQISSKLYDPNLRSLLCFGFEKSLYTMPRGNKEFFRHGFKLFRVLDLISISIPSFPSEIQHLVHLRFLALWAVVRRLPPSITNLWNLETLILGTVGTVNLPHDIWKMAKLRHLYIKKGEYHVESLPITAAAAKICCDQSFTMDNLQTMYRLCPCKGCINFLVRPPNPVCPCNRCKTFLVRTPNLRKLGLCGDLISESGCLMFPDLKLLKHLETLKFINKSFYPRRSSSSLLDMKFPEAVKRLTLQNTLLKWEEMSILGTLPNLEVLKLLDDACVGHVWNTNEDEFSQLKYLRFQRLDIVEWNAPDTPFMSLEVLVLEECKNLKVIPFDFATLPELQTIEVKCCSRSAEDSAKEIMNEQINNRGDDCMSIIIRS